MENLTKDIRGINDEFSKLDSKKEDLIKAFYEVFPIADFEKFLPVVSYYGEEYIVADVNFEELTVNLETEPCSEDNKIEVVSFGLFSVIYETYREYEITR